MRIELRIKRPTPTEATTYPPTQVLVPSRPMRVLDFDIENRPLSYLGSDFTTAEVTCIAWAWTDRPHDVSVYLLGECDLRSILEAFVHAYSQADLVTGHYVRGHDLPMVNGALMELSMPCLPEKMVSDTKLDLIRTKGLSLSQESLSAMFALEHQKESMNQAQWRAANRLSAEGLAEVRRRAEGDVKQHMELRAELVARNYLAPARLWKSGSAKAETYSP